MSEFYMDYNTLIEKDTSSDNVTTAFETLGSVTTQAADDYLIHNGTTVDIICSINDTAKSEIIVPAGNSYAGNCYQKGKRLLPGTQFSVKSTSGTISSGIIYVMVEHKK